MTIKLRLVIRLVGHLVFMFILLSTVQAVTLERVRARRDHASRQVRPCYSYPCRNGGKCIDQPDSFYGYSCVCYGPWTGINCDLNKNQVGEIGLNYPGNRPGDEVIYNSNNLNNVLNNPPYNLDPNQPTIYNSYPINDPYQYPNQQNQPGGILTSGVGIYSMVGSCTAQPCYNEGQCQPTGPYSYRCLCRYNYYGERCESYRNPKGALIGIILGIVLPFFAIAFIVSCLTYYCCCRRSD